MQQFSKWDLARLKRTAQNVDAYVKQKNKVLSKLAALQAELDMVNEQIELIDAPTVALTGYHSEELIKKIVVVTDKVTKDGMPIKITKFEFIYPDTIIPSEEPKEMGEETIVSEPIEKEVEPTDVF